jgi:hypothetical protein
MVLNEIISEVKALGLPEGEYVLCGSCPLTAAGIRETQDIDLFISDRLHDELVARGWKDIPKEGHDRPLTFGHFDAHTDWHIGSYDPSLEEMLATATVIDGVPFAALEEVKKWKSQHQRPKDLADIELIDAYLAQTSGA